MTTMSSSQMRRPSSVNVKFRQFHRPQQRIYDRLRELELAVLRCGRRFGKTTLFEDGAGNWALKGAKVGWFSPNYKLNSPSYARIHRILRPVIERSSKIDGIIELTTGGSIEFWTLSDEDAGRSRAYDRVLIDEASLIKKGLQNIWEQAIAPTLLDRRGKAAMAGTPKGIDAENFFYQACADKSLGWREFHAPTRMNPTLDPVGVAALQSKYPPLVYQQEFLAEFVDWSGAAFFSQPSLLVDGKPVPYPTNCDTVFAVIDTASKTGTENDGTAVSYYAVNKFYGIKLLLLDWDIVQIQGDLLETWLPTIFQRCQDLATQCGARLGMLGAFIEDKASGIVLNQQAARRGLPAHPIDSKLTSLGKDERAISVSGYVFRGDVKMTQYAFDKTVNFKGQTRNHFMSQIFGFRVGVKDQQDDLLDTFCYAVALTLGDDRGF